MTQPQLTQASDHSLLVSFSPPDVGAQAENEISLSTHENIVRLTSLLLADRKPFIRNVHPAYTTLLVSFDPRRTSFAAVEQYLRSALTTMESVPLPEKREVAIPVCYGGEFGPDLNDIAYHNNLTAEEVIQIHSSGKYLVYFLGFSPGFPYMGGLSEKIAAPRLATPRTEVPAGSVAIAGNQTGIYPASSPGGWRIIGRTPLRLFRPNENPPTLLQMGDVVHLKQISRDDYNQLINN